PIESKTPVKSRRRRHFGKNCPDDFRHGPISPPDCDRFWLRYAPERPTFPAGGYSMPGIYGFVQKRRFDSDYNRSLINAMRQKLEHSPEYVSDVFACDWCGLGNTALPVPGQQR